ncbi:TetR/AcrR family transcriptional regulator [Chitinophaga nivalis]|uniref:TetR/AcrR family transcriptional regulator n=1 Tax=Chitinophaga nivalis TaxID=2991709 RepID=A0ABT3IK13_9BACT|nr:TetR/AcrR family transcriptional regulator [Chitinophaga nivalis]MCW3466008.1 TetR/AcrR family transcriptional regulator [Chitinophaga nivalis]MCW3484301.1 TetR/AcrR family transcriptional regulator [Chitinophaga nivalis]
MFATQTFLNLPHKRQQQIINTAVEEFALKEYESASLSAIVQKLALAKGSFYRYFKNKEHLYRYLLSYVVDFRLEKEKEWLQPPAKDFFALLTERFKAEIRFDLAYPGFSSFLHNVAQEKNSDELGNIQEYLTASMMKPLIPAIEEQIKLGHIRKDIPATLMAFQVLQVQQNLYNYLAFVYKMDSRKNVRRKKKAFSLPEEDIQQAAAGFALLLKNGLLAPGKKK